MPTRWGQSDSGAPKSVKSNLMEERTRIDFKMKINPRSIRIGFQIAIVIAITK